MQLDEATITNSINTLETSETQQDDRPPACFLPEGDTTLRIWVKQEDGKLEWLREAWVFTMKGVGMFDGNSDFFKGISAKAKEADPDKSWSWRYQSQRIGILKGQLYPPLSPHADEKYVKVNTPTIIAINNTALKAFKQFMSTQLPKNLQEQLDIDKPAMGLKFNLKRGSGAHCNVSWDLTPRELTQPFTWGDNQEFPHLNDCFVTPKSAPTQDQKDLISADLNNRISASRPESDVPF